MTRLVGPIGEKGHRARTRPRAAAGAGVRAAARCVAARCAAALCAAALCAVLLAGCVPTTTAPPRHTALDTTTTTAPPGTTAPPTTLGPTTTVPVPPPTTAPTTAPTTTTTAPPPLVEGDSGPAVLALQQRLTALGYWLGTPDGTFGDSTQQAVYALQKAAGIARDGAVGPQTEAALARGPVPVPRTTTGDAIDVDLSDDLLMIVHDGRLAWTLNTSTGGGYTYTSEGVTAVADTPVGHFTIYREVDGLVVDPLGELWRPKYFDSGFAIHGDSDVPPEPVSHGCVRVSNEAIDWIWADNLMPIGMAVWVY